MFKNMLGFFTANNLYSNMNSFVHEILVLKLFSEKTLAQVFYYKLCEISQDSFLQNTFLQNTSGRLFPLHKKWSFPISSVNVTKFIFCAVFFTGSMLYLPRDSVTFTCKFSRIFQSSTFYRASLVIASFSFYQHLEAYLEPCLT